MTEPCSAEKQSPWLRYAGLGWFAPVVVGSVVAYNSWDIKHFFKNGIFDVAFIVLFIIAIVSLFLYAGIWTFLNKDYMTRECVDGVLEAPKGGDKYMTSVISGVMLMVLSIGYVGHHLYN